MPFHRYQIRISISSVMAWNINNPATDGLYCRDVHLGRECYWILGTRPSEGSAGSHSRRDLRDKGDVIDQLYEQILRHSFQNAKVLDTFRRVVGAIVLAKAPLRC